MNSSWLNQKWDDVEIDTAYEIVAVGDFFAQGWLASNIIDEMMLMWEANPHLTNYEVVKKWEEMYL